MQRLSAALGCLRNRSPSCLITLTAFFFPTSDRVKLNRLPLGHPRYPLLGGFEREGSLMGEKFFLNVIAADGLLTVLAIEPFHRHEQTLYEQGSFIAN